MQRQRNAPYLLNLHTIQQGLDKTGPLEPVMRQVWNRGNIMNKFFYVDSEPEFVNLLRSTGIDSQPGGIDSLESIPGLLKLLQIRAQVRVLVRCSHRSGSALPVIH